ncbi:MAG: hypothetical protein HQL26_01860 [Candidatus Omnitrophica bacterium]|nr:hypothetical protein [Candidatus Omnitrophota bacterium]
MPQFSEPLNVELGVQPIDGIMNQLKVDNAQVVKSSTEQLSFKMLKKAREGRRLNRKIQLKVWRALNITTAKNYKVEELFNYSGKL